ncbi:hypothetical protein O181_008455 [Austropuccinia psidii MF-1]|uniref:Uncharacterized protein n=1 Tax=Austropuccinia psidii MF-1 TaxID=1389203 RepID=A0A9Q3BPD7_9BASI|nr:hypothetical protein [Austropuccinia psidii MF-1]
MEGHRSTYQHETLKENPLIRRFVWEYTVTLERIICMIEEARLTILGSKFACCVPALDIVGNFLSFGRSKILKQKFNNIQYLNRKRMKKQVRGLLGLCAYGRILIRDISQAEAPLKELTTDNVLWKLNDKFEVFIKLRKMVGEKTTLQTINYEIMSGKVKSEIDSSYIESGAFLMKEDENGKETPVLYESVNLSQLDSQ